jgi:hypothetical protein
MKEQFAPLIVFLAYSKSSETHLVWPTNGHCF